MGINKKKVDIKVVSLENFRPDFRPVNEGGRRKKGEAGMKEGRKEGEGGGSELSVGGNKGKEERGDGHRLTSNSVAARPLSRRRRRRRRRSRDRDISEEDGEEEDT